MMLTRPLRVTAMAAVLLAALAEGRGLQARVGPLPVAPAPAPVAARQFGGGFASAPPLVATFDKDADGRLNAEERQAALQYAESLGIGRRGGRGYMPGTPGRSMTPTDVQPYPSTPFYDNATIRTLFLRFDDADWERQLMAFWRTDVDVPATLTVDGRAYPDVGIQFHGNSSFAGVPMGLKHSMTVSLDYVHERQDVESYNTLLLLNAHEDPSFLRTVLAHQIAREYIPAPKANLVRVVINGESWGLYVSQQHFNKDLLREQFGTTDGARWKVSGTRAEIGSGLNYLGEDIAAYRYAYEIKTKDNPDDWAALIRMTRVLDTTPPDRLEAELAPLLDIDGALKFLAVDMALVNGDGYWSKASDYSLYRHPDGRFHVLPYDVNATLAATSRGASPELNPLEVSTDPSRPLASRLLAVPALRRRYLDYVRDIATRWLDPKSLGASIDRHVALVDAEVRADTRKLYSNDAFAYSLDGLREYAARRRAFLLAATATPSVP
jgi:CotH kinase protein